MQIRFFEVGQSRTDGQGQFCGQMDRGSFVDKWTGAVRVQMDRASIAAL